MLILTRRINEQVIIGDNIAISLLDVCGKRARIGITAPKSIPIVREECLTESACSQSATEQCNEDKRAYHHTSTLKRALIADHCPYTQMVLRYYLTTVNIIVDCAHEGVAAMQLHQEKPYDLVFCELSFPDISGANVCAAIREQNQSTHVPIIALSYESHYSKQEALAAGFDDWFEKPILSTDVIAILKQWNFLAH